MDEIIFLIYSPFPYNTGGRETWLANISDRIADKSRVKIIAYKNNSLRQPFNLSPGIRVITIPTPLNIPVLGNIFKRTYFRVLNAICYSFLAFLYLLFFERKAPGKKFVSIGTLYEAFPLRMLKALRGMEYCCSVRGKHAADAGVSYPLIKKFLKKFEYKNLLHAGKIMANGFDTRDYLSSSGFSSAVIPNGVDCDNLKENRSYGVNHDNIIFLATLSEIRGLRYALKGFAKVNEDFKDASLNIAGKGNTKYWQSVVESDQILNVTFLGELKGSAIKDALIKNNIFLALVLEEYGSGISMSLLEAMAAGNAIIAWDNSIYRQVLKDGYNAILVPEKDVDHLYEAIGKLILNPGLQQTLAGNAQEEARNYDWPVVAEKFYNYIFERD